MAAALTGNAGGHNLLAGPGWIGPTPEGVAGAYRSETALALAVYRTQLYSPEDLENVKNVQSGYKVQPLSAVLGQPAPQPAPAIDFIEPLTPALSQALEGYTIGPAYAAGMEDRLGRIAPGHLADLIVVDATRDPFECDPQDLLAIQPTSTMVNGEWVWKS